MIHLRPSLPEDRSVLRELLNAVWGGDQDAAAYHGGGRVPGIVALQENRIIGYASAQRRALHTRHTYVGVHVHPGKRGCGTGAALWSEVTANISGTLKTALCGGDRAARAFLERRGLRVSVETHQPTLDLARLDQGKLERWQAQAQALGYELLPMTALDSPDGWADVARLHAQIYAHSHQHDPPDPAALQEVDFLKGGFDPAWLWLARMEGKLAGVSSVLTGADGAQGELGYFGVPAAFAEDGAALTLALTAAALQAGAQAGVVCVDAELDSADPNALALWNALPWQPGRVWLTLTSALQERE